VRSARLAVLITFACAFLANAQSDKVMKVLPHFLDLKGRHALSPSLIDRDAYQKILRENPDRRSGIRFDVQWKAIAYDKLTLRIEAKGMKGKAPQTNVLEETVRPGLFSQWNSLTLASDKYDQFGELISWRASLLNGTNIIAEQKSFLW
jgi:hypothetical protein